ncbi:hypothetical protein SPRG_21068 [Saprolegnia parasitica CBS 223.65]|uniref:CNNM transmembrane domain-containing protein n=1 Tax=Saprolegnia parasitica (strain CBS 223.65) TaxID=695850 RepID=A0A067BX72_SAPPC|nr:hypothetical protein SPRG_21068 [Saprolegnia parasitica CBS 223.65]KDO23119.1 hypothetical protein SPRG_21068 [Saprolegnia parasitica CBS 223.65]|eukprot:XP_012206244.1 hypothetical protein SPRG_21068 [Saprolegnia parasitica CBS 223.65]
MSTTEASLSTGDWVVRGLAITGLVALSAVFSGLTLGLMSLDKIGLEVVIGAGEDDGATPTEKRLAAAARKIAPIRRNGNLLLTTLLLGNVSVNSLLSILLADLTSGLFGFLVSTALIVLVGEVIPQAACSRHALAIGAKSVPFVKLIIALFYVLAKPVSAVLDAFLGQEVGTLFTKRELWKMLDIHVKRDLIDDDESWIMYGALHYKSQPVSAIMTRMHDVYMLPSTALLDRSTLRDIYAKGFSRVPVYGRTRNDVLGLLFIKDLVFVDPNEPISVLHFVHIFGRGIHRVWPDTNLGDLLKAFKMGHSRLALVQEVNNAGDGDPFLEAVGVVSLEDVIEEILQDTFRSEGDVSDGRNKTMACRDVDPSAIRRLRVGSSDDILDDDDDDMYLTLEEAKDLATHLVANQPVFQLRKSGGDALTIDDVSSLLMKCHLVEYGRETALGARIYSPSQVANHCVVVMEGCVKVTTGRHGLASEMDVWSVLGAESLVVPANTHVPDFTAVVPSRCGKILCLQITHVDFQHMLHPNVSLHPRLVKAAATPRVRSKRFALPKHTAQIHPMTAQLEFVAPIDSSNEVKRSLLQADSMDEMQTAFE